MSKNTPTLLKTAAELRSCGASWAAVGRSPRTCEQWPRLFRPTWDGLYRDAEQRRFTETGGEATAVLQQLLRDGDHRTKLCSADVLLRTRHQLLMLELSTVAPRSVADTAALKRGRRLQTEKSLDEKKPVLGRAADELPPAAAIDPNDVVLRDSTELHSEVAARAEPDPAALPTPAPALPTPAPACPAPSKSRNGSLRGMAFGVLLLIFMLLLTALSQRQSNASGGFDSCGKEAREPARYRAIPLDKPFEKVLNPALTYATPLARIGWRTRDVCAQALVVSETRLEENDVQIYRDPGEAKH